MTRLSPQRSIALPAETWERIRVRAEARQITQAQFVRAAIDFYFDLAEGSGANLQRVAELCEYSQLALDRIVRRDFPELLDPILAAVNERLVTHHGK